VRRNLIPAWFRTALALLFVFWNGSLSAQEPIVRATVPENGQVWVGERAKIVIDLLAPGYFSGAPSFDLPRVANVLLIPSEERPVLGSEAIQGVNYTVQHYELPVFARRAGEYQIPPFAIRFKFKRSPLDKEALEATVQTPPIQFRAVAPPGAENLAGVLSSVDVKCTEAWQPELNKAKVGDAFTRTVTFSASDIPAMAFPPFPISEVDGIGAYGKPPVLNDQSERGVMRGERQDIVTYVCERPGHFVIPAARLTWWDLNSKQLRTIDLPARIFEVAPNPALPTATVAETNPESSQIPPMHLVLFGVAISVIAAFLWKTWSFWRGVLARFRPTHLVPLNPSDLHRLPESPASLPSGTET
jgi:hypothetical protein